MVLHPQRRTWVLISCYDCVMIFEVRRVQIHCTIERQVLVLDFILSSMDDTAHLMGAIVLINLSKILYLDHLFHIFEVRRVQKL